MKIERGDLVLVDFDPTKGAEIKKTRPAIVVTNNIANKFSRVITIVPITSQKLDKIYPHEVLLPKQTGLLKDSKANAAQLRAVDKLRIVKRLGTIGASKLKELNIAMKLHLGIE
jgi:mRNA interferase MazF